MQSDKNAERIKFSCPKIVGDNLDLSKFSIRINFENVSIVDPDISIKDQYICEDASINGDNITFSWVIGKNAARYMGTTRFIVCAVKTDSDSNISIEWNTTVAQIPVLEGIEIDQPSLDENNKDVINQLLAITKTASDEAVKNVNSAKEQAITEIQNVLQPDKTLTVEGGIADAKATGNAISSLREDLDDVRIKYTNLFNINPNIQDVIVNDNSGYIYVNENYIDIEEGKPYFVYVKFKITNLINWSQGYVYARMIYAVDAGGWKDTHLKAIKNNSEFSICYNFIAKKSGKVGVQLYFNNQLPASNSFNCQVLKANMRVVGATEYALVFYRNKLPKFRNGAQTDENGKTIRGTGKMVFNWFQWEKDRKDIPKIHPAQKPVAVLKRLIEIFTDPGDVVIDPCCGSGSTLRAAMELGRSAYGFEIDRNFYQRAKDEMIVLERNPQMNIKDFI